jgi:hypothetical protein
MSYTWFAASFVVMVKVVVSPGSGKFAKVFGVRFANDVFVSCPIGTVVLAPLAGLPETTGRNGVIAFDPKGLPPRSAKYDDMNTFWNAAWSVEETDPPPD